MREREGRERGKEREGNERREMRMMRKAART